MGHANKRACAWGATRHALIRLSTNWESRVSVDWQACLFFSVLPELIKCFQMRATSKNLCKVAKTKLVVFFKKLAIFASNWSGFAPVLFADCQGICERQFQCRDASNWTCGCGTSLSVPSYPLQWLLILLTSPLHLILASETASSHNLFNLTTFWGQIIFRTSVT